MEKNYIKGQCQTNLDDYSVSAITIFAAVPRRGDKVACVNKAYSNSGATTLTVVDITHTQMNGEPFIIVELNK